MPWNFRFLIAIPLLDSQTFYGKQGSGPHNDGELHKIFIKQKNWGNYQSPQCEYSQAAQEP